MFHSKQKSGFTLVELLVVIAIITMLVAIAIPAVLMARERARRLQCANNLRNLGGAIQGYENFKQKYPGWINEVGGNDIGGNVAGWPVMLLQELDRRDLWSECRDPATDLSLVQVQVSTFICPSSGLTGNSLSYVANCGQQDMDPTSSIPPDWAANGVFFQHDDSAVEVNLASADLKDGQQYTLLLSENLQAGSWTSDSERLLGMVWWLGGNSFAAEPTVADYLRINANLEEDRATVISGSSYNYARPSSNHPDGANMLYCDGHVDFRSSDDIDFQLYAQWMASDDSQVLFAGHEYASNETESDKLREWIHEK